MEYINRNKSLITGKENLEHLYTFKDFPVFIWCTHEPKETDLVADMSFSICKDTWFIQLDKVLPLDVIYSWYHSEALWWLWQEHHNQFINFINKYWLSNILEIWGSNGLMAKKYISKNNNTKWTMVEPNPAIASDENITVVKSMFDENFKISNDIDWIIHSHVLEHMYFPLELIRNISSSTKIWGYHMFSIPNLYEYLNEKFTNCMNFEHTTFLTEYFIDYLLAKYWFEILEKKYFHKHSIFYATKKVSHAIEFQFQSKFDDYKKMFLDYIDNNNEIINELNNLIQDKNWNVYLFGAHIFSQYLLNRWLNRWSITGIIDNSLIKQWKRLYWTDFMVFSPEILKNKSNPVVILRAWGYQEEIRKQLLEINPNIEILE